MNSNSGCGFAILVTAILVAMALTFAAMLASVGVAPVIDGAGLAWDSTAYVTRSNNQTQLAIAKQREETERNRQLTEAVRTVVIALGVVAIVAIIAGVAGVAIVQHNRTRRQRADVQLKLQMYLAYIGGNGAVGRYHGQLGVFDHDHGEFIPAGVALLEMRDN